MMNRRNALGLFGAAALALPVIPAQDAAIIRAVDRLLAVRAELDRLCDLQRLTIADERRTQDECDALMDQSNDIVDELEHLPPPRSRAGIKAYAQAALVMHGGFERDGERFATDRGEWLALTALEQLVAA